MARKARRQMKRHENRTKKALSRDDSEKLRALPFYKMAAELETLAVEQALTRANHYGGYRVGAAGLVLLPDGSHVIVMGANKKTAPGDRRPTDHCAEHELENEAHKRGGEIIGEVVVSPHKIDDSTAFDFKVNISCWYCRQRYREITCDPVLEKKTPYKRNTIMRYVDLNDRSKQADLTIGGVVALCKVRDAEKARSR